VQACTRWHFAFGLCCRINATHAQIANPPNTAQLGSSPTTPPSYIWVRAIVWAYGHRQTDTHTQTHMTTIHFASSTTHAKCNKWSKNFDERLHNREGIFNGENLWHSAAGQLVWWLTACGENLTSGPLGTAIGGLWEKCGRHRHNSCPIEMTKSQK